MAEAVKHECGIAFLRLLKPLDFYLEKYQTPFYGLDKMQLLMEKQHNRGQDGAGIANIKLNLKPGTSYISRLRSNAERPIFDIFNQIYKPLQEISRSNPQLMQDTQWLKENMPFMGEVFLGHLRYGTFGKNNLENLHPVVRFNNWMTRNLVLAGNFNMTNVGNLFNLLVELGQFPVETGDTVTILEKIGHHLDKENERLYREFKNQGYSKKDATILIGKGLDLVDVLKRSADSWDGGYVIGGMIGHGDSFVMRDPAGIRPAFWYQDDEIVVAASERPVIQTAFNLDVSQIQELEPAHALIVRRNGNVSLEAFANAKEKRACSFERIYFSRGTDADIYPERKTLGKQLVQPILETINYDLENSVFSYIPNTAASAFIGLVDGLNEHCDEIQKQRILDLGSGVTQEHLTEIFKIRPRFDTIAVKDLKLRTFITQDQQRNDLVTHIYDVTYGVVKRGKDNLVVVDDSIVRGTTLKQSIIRILDRLGPKKIVIVSSAPQIRYPDCYGIDMAKIGDFIAFTASIELLKETNQTHVIDEVYQKCRQQGDLPIEQIENQVKAIYAPFSVAQIEQKISELLTPADCKAEVQILFQRIEGLHRAIPYHTGDWFFTGNYPTPGGNQVVNQSFINYYEGKNRRAY